jgi:hypothetical protein
MPIKLRHVLFSLPLVVASCWWLPGIAQPSETLNARGLISGHWVINDELSDNTDDQVEEAIKAAGGRVQRRGLFAKKVEDRYRGGPADQELYDRLSYDDVLTITYDDPEIVFEYADNFRRVFHTDGRRRSTGVNDYFESGGVDYTFGNWNGQELLVEGRPRDGGYTLESYTLEAQGQRLRIEMTLQPFVFGAPINLVRIFDRMVQP